VPNILRSSAYCARAAKKDSPRRSGGIGIPFLSNSGTAGQCLPCL
jgi:hypothetical protein